MIYTFTQSRVYTHGAKSSRRYIVLTTPIILYRAINKWRHFDIHACTATKRISFYSRSTHFRAFGRYKRETLFASRIHHTLAECIYCIYHSSRKQAGLADGILYILLFSNMYNMFHVSIVAIGSTFSARDYSHFLFNACVEPVCHARSIYNLFVPFHPEILNVHAVRSRPLQIGTIPTGTAGTVRTTIPQQVMIPTNPLSPPAVILLRPFRNVRRSQITALDQIVEFFLRADRPISLNPLSRCGVGEFEGFAFEETEGVRFFEAEFGDSPRESVVVFVVLHVVVLVLVLVLGLVLIFFVTIAAVGRCVIVDMVVIVVIDGWIVILQTIILIVIAIAIRSHR